MRPRGSAADRGRVAGVLNAPAEEDAADAELFADTHRRARGLALERRAVDGALARDDELSASDALAETGQLEEVLSPWHEFAAERGERGAQAARRTRAGKAAAW